MEDLYEKQISSEVVFNGKVVDVSVDKVLLKNGKTSHRDVVHHKGGVVIAAKKENKILMVNQYRYPIGQPLRELPAGKLDKKDEDVLEAAKRELLEETGCSAEKWTSLGFVYSTPGFCSEKLHLFLAEDLSFGEQNLDEDEIINCEFIELSEIKNMIKTNQITDAKTICAVARAFLL